MKKVIYSPEVGGPKSLFGADQPAEQQSSYVPNSRLVNSEEFTNDAECMESFRTTIDDLKRESKSLKQERDLLQKELDELKQNILAEKKRAEESGYQEAISKVQLEIDRQVDERVAAGEEILNKLKNEVMGAVYDQEGICLEIIYSAISRLIGESAGSKKQIKEILKLTMEKVASMDNLDVYVSAHDYEMLKGDDFVTQNIIKSADIEHGGCVIRSGKGSVAAKLDDQLVKLKDLLLDIHKVK